MEGKKIDVGQYFKSIEPPQIQNVLKNFYQELAEGRRKFKEILLKKYHNILSCKDNFQEMLASCDQAEQNIIAMHDALQALDIGCIEKITQELESLGEEFSSEGKSNEQRDFQKEQKWIMEYLGEQAREKKRFMEVQMVKEKVVESIKAYLVGKIKIDEVICPISSVLAISLQSQSLFLHLRMFIKRLIQIDLAIDKDLSNTLNWIQIMSHLTFKLITLKLNQTSEKSIDHVMPLIQDYQQLIGLLQVKKASSKTQVLKCQAILDLQIMIGNHLCKELVIDPSSLKLNDQQAFERQSSDFINNLKQSFKYQCHSKESELLSVTVFKSRVPQILSLLSGLNTSTSNETSLSKSLHHQITQLLFETLKNLISAFSENIFTLITPCDQILSKPLLPPSQDPIVKDIREEVYQVYQNHNNIRDANVLKQREQIIKHMSAVLQAREQIQQWFIENQECFGPQFREYVEFAKNTDQVIQLKLSEKAKEGGFNQGCMALMASGYIDEGANGSQAIEQMLVDQVGKELASKVLYVKESGYSKPYRVLKNEYDKEYVFMASKIQGHHCIQPASHGLVQKLRACFFNTIKECLSAFKDELLQEWLERVPQTELKFIKF